jgi:hypothetical protein
MTTQKIVVLSIDADNGDHALEQIRTAAGGGAWRIVSLLDLGEERPRWVPDQTAVRRVLAVLEEDPRVEAGFTAAVPFAEAVS